MNLKAWSAPHNPACRKNNQDNQHSETDNSPRDGIYMGESSHSLRECAKEHVKDAQAFSAKSHIMKHWMTSHPSLPYPPEMEFSITSRFRDCLSRQIGEALRISFSKDNLLNSKAEYMANSLNRLTMKEDPWELKERTRKEEKMEELNKKRVEEFKRLKSAQQCSTNLETVPTQESELDNIVENTVKQDLLQTRALQSDQLTTNLLGDHTSQTLPQYQPSQSASHEEHHY